MLENPKPPAEVGIVAPIQVSIRYAVLGWLLALLALVAVRMLSGQISLRGLLHEKTAAGPGAVSGARVQLLLATIAAAATYITDTLAATPAGGLPEINTAWLGVLGASNGIHLVAKLVAALRARRAGGAGTPAGSRP